jgi:hypothetical protein
MNLVVSIATLWCSFCMLLFSWQTGAAADSYLSEVKNLSKQVTVRFSLPLLSSMNVVGMNLCVT